VQDNQPDWWKLERIALGLVDLAVRTNHGRQPRSSATTYSAIVAVIRGGGCGQCGHENS
jgi:hypothetical protein